MPQLSASARRIARVVRFTPGITRRGVADRLGVSVTTVNPLVAELVGRGALVERRAPGPSRGRPSSGLHFHGDRDVFAFVLWSHGVLDVSLLAFDGEVVRRERTTVSGHPDVDRLAAATERLVALARTVPGVTGPQCLVFGIPAPYERGVGLPGSTPEDVPGADRYADWFAADPRAMLAERFGLPVAVVNDANLGALGETRDGAAVGGRCVLAITMSGLGIGAGITVHGDLLEGSHGFAGELSHVRVDDTSTVICICGSRGCLKEQLGPGMLEPLVPVYGEDLTYGRLLELVADGDAGPVRVLEDAGRTVGRAMAGIATFLDPDVIVVDAGASAATGVVVRGMAEQLQQSTPPFIRRGLELRASALGGSAPVHGAVHVARAAATHG